MDQIQAFFLKSMKASLQQESVQESLSLEEYASLFALAGIHNVLPMVYASTLSSIPQAYLDSPLIKSVRNETIHAVARQTMKTQAFLRLYEKWTEADVHPIVVKGLVCRNVYPSPDARLSNDEDVWVNKTDYSQALAVLTACGMVTTEQDPASVYEVPYIDPKGSLYIELHQSLFPPESEVYGDWNRYFVHAETTEIIVDGTKITTLNATDHLFYLICHAFKHFMHSGFGIRQVCDVIMFANAYGTSIDWERVYVQCEQIRALRFACAMFAIGTQYLTFDAQKAHYPLRWSQVPVETDLFLKDLLEAGVFGDSSLSRKHSSTMTLDAIGAQKTGRKKKGIRASLFPSAGSLQSRYPYLKKHPYLLPIAWGSRILKYRAETRTNAQDDAGSSIAIAKERIALMKQMGVMDEE